MTITEKVAYLKGLADGLNLNKETPEGKVIAAMMDILDDMALNLADLNDQVDAIDEDLELVEEYVYEEDDDDFDECSGDCDGCTGCDDFDYDEDEGAYEFECPNCHETIFFDESLFEDDEYDLECPACGVKLELEEIFEDEDDED